MASMSTVYITQVPTRKGYDGESRPLNIEPAGKFGKVDVLFPAGMWAPGVPNYRKLREKLASFSDDDYLLALGDPALMVAAGAVAADANDGRINLLVWSREERCYIPVQLDIYGRAL